VDWGSLMAGQVAGLVRKIQPASEIIREIFNEAGDVLERLRVRFPGP